MTKRPDPNTIALIERLIAFDTTSRESNLDLIAFIRDQLTAIGVESTLIPDETGTKANLYATIGPADVPGVMLSGHTDVVPVDGQDWASDPFAATLKGGKMFGRGTADMKSFIALCLHFAPRFKAAKLTMPIHLAFSYDEEIGCIGARRLVESINGLPVKPAMCVVGEPTSMEVMIAHKGKVDMRVTVTGLEAHSSHTTAGVNAIEYAARLIARLGDLGAAKAEAGPFDPDYIVPHSTVHVGVIRGGTALNIVPKSCWFDFEIRYIPGDDVMPIIEEMKAFARDELEPKMHAVDAATGIDFEERINYPGMNTAPDADVVAFVKALAGKNDHGKVAYGTEGGLFQSQAGIPTVICGPGDIAQAHKPDEFISLDQLARGEAFFERLLAELTRI